MLSTLLVLALGGAPLADVWPFAAKRMSDGSIEYSYEFAALRGSSGPVDARERHGDEAVRAFLKGLPREAKVRLAPGTAIDVSAGRGPESRPLDVTYGQVFEGAIESENPLAKSPGARLRPPLHPDEPKLLVGAEQLTFEVRALEDAALAAIELDTDRLRRELWAKVGDRAITVFKTADGDAREGALALAARVLAASSCLDAERARELARQSPELIVAVAAEVQHLATGSDVRFGPPPYTWSPELTCAWVRERAMGAPFEQSRAGTAAVLTYLLFLEQDAKVKALDARLRARRERFEGTPLSDALASWRQAAHGNVTQALDSIGEFIDALPTDERVPPALMALPSTAFLRFLSELNGPERGAAWEELATAVQDGRVQPGKTGWPALREAALVPLVTEPPKALQLDASWREQLRATFALAQGGASAAPSAGSEPDPDPGERTELKVRLMVPPLLEVEPTPELFSRLAESLDALGQALAAEGLQGLQGLTADGRRTDWQVRAEALRLVPRLRSLALLAAPDAKTAPWELEAARRYLKGWRSESASTRDVRGTTPFFLSLSDEREHAFVLGLTRRELTVGFASAPRVEIVGAPAQLIADATARQRYIVPVLRSTTVPASPARRAMDRKDVRALVDAALRDPAKVDTVISEALKQ